MDDESYKMMRSYILATDHLGEPKLQEEVIMEEASVPPNVVLLHDLKEIVFKLRAFTESEDSDASLGIEMGMQRAADMIENLIKRHTEGHVL